MRVQDKFINDILYKPPELFNVCCYEMLLWYEKVSLQGKNDTTETESETYFKFCEEHPSAKYIALKKRKIPVIPEISSTKLLPDVLTTLATNNSDKNERERYAQIALLLFLPFSSRDELKVRGSYWNKYLEAKSKGLIWKKGLEILQNIQDVNYNCNRATEPQDPLNMNTVLMKSDKDDEIRKRRNKKNNAIHIREIERQIGLGQLSQVGLTEDQPDVMSRSMKAVIDRGNLSEQDVNVTVLPNEHSDITNIPVNISKLLKKSTTPIHTPNIFTNDTNSLPFIITTINSTVLGLTSPTASNLDANDGISLSKISAKHTLDFKQRAAFETVCSSFLLSQLKQEETTLQSRVNNLLPQNQNNSQHLHLPVGSVDLRTSLDPLQSKADR